LDHLFPWPIRSIRLLTGRKARGHCCKNNCQKCDTSFHRRFSDLMFNEELL